MQARWFAVGLAAAACFGQLAAADRSSDPIVSRIPHHPVESHGLAAVGYSKRLHALEIEFHRGGTYRYLEVPAAMYRDLLAAESKAHFYNAHIRGKYRAVRVRTQATDL